MKTKTLFICDVCGTQYDDEDACVMCEKNHTIPKKVVEVTYIAELNKAPAYPDYITIEFDDGRRVRYGFIKAL